MDESTEVLRVVSLLDTTLAQTLDSISQVLVKKYSYSYYSKASGVVVSFYLRGNRFPLQTVVPVDSPETPATYETPIEQLRASYLASKPPVTPVRQHAESRWGRAGMDMEGTPGLVQSDLCSSGIDVDLDVDVEDEPGKLDYDDTRSVRSFSQPREFDDMDDDEEDECGNGHGEEYADEEEFDMDLATMQGGVLPPEYARPPSARLRLAVIQPFSSVVGRLGPDDASHTDVPTGSLRHCPGPGSAASGRRQRRVVERQGECRSRQLRSSPSHCSSPSPSLRRVAHGIQW